MGCDETANELQLRIPLPWQKKCENNENWNDGGDLNWNEYLLKALYEMNSWAHWIPVLMIYVIPPRAHNAWGQNKLVTTEMSSRLYNRTDEIRVKQIDVQEMTTDISLSPWDSVVE